jgi:selenocysteine-specific elongation factor
MPAHEVSFDNEQQAEIQKLMRRFEQNPFSPPGFKDSQAEAGAEVLNALIETEELVLVSGDVLFRKPDYDVAVHRIHETLLKKGTITLAEVRDLLKTSRKYAQALLEHLDTTGLTLRDGDVRRLKKK